MKKNVVVAAEVGVRMTELGAFEIAIKDLEGHTHTTVFLPSTVQGLRDLLAQIEPLPAEWVAVESIGIPASKVLKRVAAIERSQSAGWSVQAVPTEQTVALAVLNPATKTSH